MIYNQCGQKINYIKQFRGYYSDEFELKFPELKSFQAESSRAEHFNFRAETEPFGFLQIEIDPQNKPKFEKRGREKY